MSHCLAAKPKSICFFQDVSHIAPVYTDHRRFFVHPTQLVFHMKKSQSPKHYATSLAIALELLESGTLVEFLISFTLHLFIRDEYVTLLLSSSLHATGAKKLPARFLRR